MFMWAAVRAPGQTASRSFAPAPVARAGPAATNERAQATPANSTNDASCGRIERRPGGALRPGDTGSES
jgi:hypothetical protein